MNINVDVILLSGTLKEVFKEKEKEAMVARFKS